MSAPKFTPGPWEVCVVSFPDAPRIGAEIIATDAEGDDFVVARTSGRGEDAQRDALLIAAAPDLWEALSELVAEFDRRDAETGGDYGLRETLGMKWARAALAKAEGSAT